jgi:putative membrane protein
MKQLSPIGLMIPALVQMVASVQTSEPVEKLSWSSWSWPPGILVPLLLFVVMYAIGIFKMLKGRARQGVRVASVVYFACGSLSLFIALDSPIHEIGEQLFWVHMTQHEILMVISAPLLVMSRPLVPMMWALPERFRGNAAAIARQRTFSASWAAISAPAAAWTLHAAALWLWHVPYLFDQTFTSDVMHSAQHLSFLGSALLFWWALIHCHGRKLGYGGSVLYVFTTAIHMSLLGALLTFSNTVWYAPYAATAPAWHLTGLEDQQLGGLIMWIPAGTILLIVTLALLVQWLRDSEQRWEYTRTAALLHPSRGERP